MTEYKVGDRLTYSGELVVVEDTESWMTTVTVRHRHGETEFPVFQREVTKIVPALPTRIGTVIDSHGYRFILTRNGWHATVDKNPYPIERFKNSMYAEDFTVVLEGE